MGLFTPGWQKFDTKKGLRSVKRIKDQKTLAGIARTAPLDEVRRAALERIGDDLLLVSIATEKNRDLPLTWNERKRALERIKNETLQVEAAVSMRSILSLEDEKALADRIKSQDALFRLAKESFNIAAFRKITDDRRKYELCMLRHDYSRYAEFTDRELRVQLGLNLGFGEETTDYAKELIAEGDPRGIDILVKLIRNTGKGRGAPDAAVNTLMKLYREAQKSGDEEMLRRIRALPDGKYGAHTDIRYKDCGYGDHNDQPQAHFDLKRGEEA